MRAQDRGDVENVFSRYMHYHNAFEDQRIIDELWVHRGTEGVRSQYNDDGVYTGRLGRAFEVTLLGVGLESRRDRGLDVVAVRMVVPGAAGGGSVARGRLLCTSHGA